MSGKKPKRSSKNLKINTRIVLTTVLAIAIPLVLVALVCLGLLHSTSHTFQLAAETADRYSLVNQIGWNQTVSNLSDVLLRTKDTDAEKLADISKFQTELKVTISISSHKTPVITADTEWSPEKWVDDHNIGKELQDIRRYLEFDPRIAINSQEIGD